MKDIIFSEIKLIFMKK